MNGTSALHSPSALPEIAVRISLGTPFNTGPFRYQRHCIPLEIFRVIASLSFFCCHRSPRYGILQP